MSHVLFYKSKRSSQITLVAELNLPKRDSLRWWNINHFGDDDNAHTLFGLNSKAFVNGIVVAFGPFTLDFKFSHLVAYNGVRVLELRADDSLIDVEKEDEDDDNDDEKEEKKKEKSDLGNGK